MTIFNDLLPGRLFTIGKTTPIYQKIGDLEVECLTYGGTFNLHPDTKITEHEWVPWNPIPYPVLILVSTLIALCYTMTMALLGKRYVMRPAKITNWYSGT